MQFFIDTANIDEIRTAKSWGILDGCTTNPSLVSKENKEFKTLVKEICDIVDGPVSAETVATDAEGIIREARALSRIHRHVVCKVPLIREGITAVAKLSREGIKTNVTLVFSANQALLAAKAGATYVSPFLGRLDDIGQEGLELLAEIRDMYDNYGYKTQLLAASLRHATHVKHSALIGADVATMPFNVMEQLFKHSLTDAGLKRFLDDWQRIPEKLRKI